MPGGSLGTYLSKMGTDYCSSPKRMNKRLYQRDMYGPLPSSESVPTTLDVGLENGEKDVNR